MKFIVPTTILAILLIMGGSITYWQSNARLPLKLSETSVADQIDAAINQFTAAHIPDLHLSTSNLPQMEYPEDLIAPSAALPFTYKLPADASAALYKYAEDCNDQHLKDQQYPATSPLYKAYLWHQFICKRTR